MHTFLLRHKSYLGVFLGGTIVGVGVGMLNPVSDYADAIANINITSEKSTGDALTSPLLDCEVNGNTAGSGLIPFGDELNRLTEDIVSSGKASSVAVYYRDLNNGPWLGVNESDAYLPASLLKVPVMIAYFKAAETDPAILSQKIRFENPIEAPDGGVQTIQPSQNLEVGKEYTAEDLIERTIMYSDNQAVQLLYQHIDPKFIFDVYHRIGVDSKAIEGPGAVLSPREYSAFFRVLYNASYLNREMSEKALGILTRVEQKQGLVSGVPAGTAVAHKFGEAGYQDDLLQYHDCGIVYHPKRHYLLCIMTQGKDVKKLETTIQDLSRFVWEEVDTQL